MAKIKGYVSSENTENETFQEIDDSQTQSTVESFETKEEKPVFTESAQPAPQQTPLSNPSVERIVIPLKDVSAKYTDLNAALDSILIDGEYYEDYLRSGKTDLFKSKEFILTAISQNPDRLYAPETPKPSDWLDEEYLAAKISSFYTDIAEGQKPEHNAALSQTLYQFLLKSGFSPESYDIIIAAAKRTMKVFGAMINSYNDGLRAEETFKNFNASFNNALTLAKNIYILDQEAKKQKTAKLAQQKSILLQTAENMKFDI